MKQLIIIKIIIFWTLVDVSMSQSNRESPVKIWPNAHVPFKLDKEFTNKEATMIVKTMEEITEKTCITFTISKSTEHFLRVDRGRPNSGCWSLLGYRLNSRGFQKLNLESTRCVQPSIVMRQLLHSLGLPQEGIDPVKDVDYDYNEGNGIAFKRAIKTESAGYLNSKDALNVMELYGNQKSCEDSKKPTAAPWMGHVGRAHIYDELDHKGTREDFNERQIATIGCQNLKKVLGQVRSIHTYNTCVQVYHDPDCKGRSLQFHPWSRTENGQGYQSHWRVGDDWQGIKSVGPCTRAPPHVPCLFPLFQCSDGICVTNHWDCYSSTNKGKRQALNFNGTSTL